LRESFDRKSINLRFGPNCSLPNRDVLSELDEFKDSNFEIVKPPDQYYDRPTVQKSLSLINMKKETIKSRSLLIDYENEDDNQAEFQIVRHIPFLEFRILGIWNFLKEL